MANTILQNCQRGIIFITFLLVLLGFILTVISLIKKRIDSTDEDKREGASGGEKYEEGAEKPKRTATEQSADRIEQGVIDSSKIKEDDPTVVKVIKKYNQFLMNFFPLLIVVPLNILTGTSKAFCFVFYLFTLVVVILFNVFEIHRKCIEHKCVRVIVENVWIVMLFFVLLNVWAASASWQPYVLVAG